eukprot:TRINITY_DN323_c0_g1_i1.p1 TRINITY_DN323_c0_g1~~TRINITY_DN323_c0_g1_i1.p1  ORF type:complete len:251 (+),score=51.84 TRINITY_DN323_c0_g1_i1:23-754(+)
MLLNLVDACWTSWQNAMEEGTVAEWVCKYLSPDIVVCDYVSRSGLKVARGHDGVCMYYNKVLERSWGGDCKLTWGLEGATAVGPDQVKVIFNLSLVPMPLGHVARQVWHFRLDAVNRVSEIVVAPVVVDLPVHCPSSRRGSASTTVSTSGSSGASASPCHHNSWENVRIKRGWAVLRCRECSTQWRLRPSEIDRCPEFGKEIGRRCSHGDACSRLHIHFTRLKREMVLKQRQVVKHQHIQHHA